MLCGSPNITSPSDIRPLTTTQNFLLIGKSLIHFYLSVYFVFSNFYNMICVCNTFCYSLLICLISDNVTLFLQTLHSLWLLPGAAPIYLHCQMPSMCLLVFLSVLFSLTTGITEFIHSLISEIWITSNSQLRYFTPGHFHLYYVIYIFQFVHICLWTPKTKLPDFLL